MNEKILLTKEDINDIIDKNSSMILDKVKDLDNFAIIGIQTRGVNIAERLKSKMEKLSGKTIKSGILDITFHRDDLNKKSNLPVVKETRIDFDISEMEILLVDDVVFSGRTTKAALDTLVTFGRPASIRYFVLVDRGNREFPIQPDYCGFKIVTKIKENVQVLLNDVDNEDDKVILHS